MHAWEDNKGDHRIFVTTTNPYVDLDRLKPEDLHFPTIDDLRRCLNNLSPAEQQQLGWAPISHSSQIVEVLERIDRHVADVDKKLGGIMKVMP